MHSQSMSTNQPHTTGLTLEQLLDSIIFSDPATHVLRDEWERTKAEEQAVFERVCQEEYEGRKMYHEICKTPDPDAAARHEATLLRPMLKEELDAAGGAVGDHPPDGHGGAGG